MLCDNCGKREANVRYTENINGRKKELHLCEKCSEKLGISKMDFNMPIDFSSFFGGFMENIFEPDYMPFLNEVKELKCENCGYTFQNIANTGKLGCANCYDIFESKLDPIIRKIQGANQHTGRTGKILENKIIEQPKNEGEKAESKIEQLQKELKKAIKEERYEDAAKIRDEIKKGKIL